MKTIILDHIHLSGKYTEITFGSGNDLVWILFNINDEDEWVGKFETGFLNTSKVIIAPDHTDCFILAQGNVYGINALKREQLFKIEIDYIEDIIHIPQMNNLILSDGLHLRYFDLDRYKISWKSDRISWDGILFESYQNGIIKGKLNDLSEQYCSCPFEFNVSKKSLKVHYNVPPPK